MKILVTGATGFVGANLTRRWITQGHDVVAVSGPVRSHWRLPENAQRLAVDLGDESAIRAMIAMTQPEVVVNCAAYGSYPSQTDTSKIYRICFDAPRILLESVRELKNFKALIQMGSQSEYGLNCTAPSETQATTPDSDYAAAKVGATAVTQLYGKKYGVPAWSFRLYSIYGPYEDTSRLIIRLVSEALQNRLPPLVNPRVSRDFVHVDDVARAVEAVIAQADRLPKGEVYNIATGKCTTLEQLVATAQQAFGLTAKPEWGSMPDRHWDHAEWYGNPAKALRDLGWKADVTLREGLIQTLNWIQQNPQVMLEAARQSVVPR